MTALLDSIRRIVAEDAAHKGVMHELYLTRKTCDDIEADLKKSGNLVSDRRHWFKAPSLLGLPLHIQNVGRDCIATLRDGKIISVTNL